MNEHKVKRRNRAKKVFVIAVGFAVLFVLARYFFDLDGMLRRLLEWIRGLGLWAGLVFVAVYSVATVLFIPGTLLTLGAGVVFGLWWGVVTVSVAATLGALAAFLVGRYGMRGWVEAKLQGDERFRAIDRAVGREGWKIVLLTRLSPVFPFNLLNYAFGLTQVRTSHYFFASWIGMIPGTVLYVFVGSLTGDLARLGAEGRSRSAVEWGFYALGLAATLAVTVYVTRLSRRALQGKLPERRT